MEINNNTTNLSFQARVPKALKNELRDEALNHGSKAIKNINAQIRKVEKWGSSFSEIILPMTKNGDIFERSNTLALYNNKLSEHCTAPLPEKSSLFKSFMSLREKDIVKAEEKLKMN